MKPTHYKRHEGDDWEPWLFGDVDLGLFGDMRDPDFIKTMTVSREVVRFHAIYTRGDTLEWNSIDGITVCKQPPLVVVEPTPEPVKYETVSPWRNVVKCKNCNHFYLSLQPYCPRCFVLNRNVVIQTLSPEEISFGPWKIEIVDE